MVLHGKRVLVVEDEALLLLTLKDMLDEMGCEAVQGKIRLRDAVPQARELPLDIGVLDVNLDGYRVDPVADALAERSIPFIFATGYAQPAVPAAYKDRPIVSKPYR